MIAGIDFSLNCPSICIYDRTKELIPQNVLWFYFKTKPTKKEKSIQHSNNIFSEYMEYDYEIFTERAFILADWVLSIIDNYNITDVILEDYALGASGKVFNIAEATGLVKFLCYSKGINLHLYAPSQIKKHFTGKGNSNKEKMLESFIEKYNYDISKEFNGTTNSPVSDLIDSFAIVYTFLLTSSVN